MANDGEDETYPREGWIDQKRKISCSHASALIKSANCTYGSLGLGSASNGSANTYYTRDNNGRLVSQRTSTGTYYYSLNSLGSVSVITDSTGAVKNTYTYDPWGNSLGKTEAVSNPWQFASGYLDATTGLYKFGTRYYSPMLGRWTQKDPVGGTVGKVGSGNAYIYADNAPVMMTDPSGRIPQSVFGVFGSAFSFLAGLAQSVWAVGILTGTSASIEALGGAYAIIVNSLLPGLGLAIIGGIIAFAVVAVTFCGVSQNS